MATEGRMVYAVQLGLEEREILRKLVVAHMDGLRFNGPSRTRAPQEYAAHMKTANGALMALNTGASGYVDPGMELVTVPIAEADKAQVQRFLHATQGLPLERLTTGFMLGVAWGGLISQASVREATTKTAPRKEGE